MEFFTKKFITFSMVPYKYNFQMLKGLKLMLNMPGVFLTPVCHRRVKISTMDVRIFDNCMICIRIKLYTSILIFKNLFFTV